MCVVSANDIVILWLSQPQQQDVRCPSRIEAGPAARYMRFHFRVDKQSDLAREIKQLSFKEVLSLLLTKFILYSGSQIVVLVPCGGQYCSQAVFLRICN